MNFPPHKGGLFLSHNEHKNYYQTVAEWIADNQAWLDVESWVSPAQKQKAIDTNECWRLQWYPDTPVGSYAIMAADLDALLAAANAIDQ